MDAQNVSELLDSAARQHRTLADRAGLTTPDQVVAVLNLGTAVLVHGLLEQAQVYEANPYLDPAVVEHLVAEHDRLARDLRLLEEIWRTRPDSEDVAPLSAALLRSLSQHLERDQRTLYEPLRRFELASGADPGQAAEPGSRRGADG